MPNFSKMMGNYPFNLIQGLGPTVKAAGAGMAAGGLYGGTGRRGSMGRAAKMGIAGGALGAIGGAAYLNRDAISTFGRNVMRPGGAAGYGAAVASASRSGLERGGAFARSKGMRGLGKGIRNLAKMF